MLDPDEGRWRGEKREGKVGPYAYGGLWLVSSAYVVSIYLRYRPPERGGEKQSSPKKTQLETPYLDRVEAERAWREDVPYRGTSLIRDSLALGSYSRSMPGDLPWSKGGGGSF